MIALNISIMARSRPASRWTLFLSLVVLIACIVVPGGEIPTWVGRIVPLTDELRPAVTVKHENFKKCEQSGFVNGTELSPIMPPLMARHGAPRTPLTPLLSTSKMVN